MVDWSSGTALGGSIGMSLAQGKAGKYWDPNREERSGEHTAYGDIGRFIAGGLTPEQTDYAEYVRNMQSAPIEGAFPYAERYANQATMAARPGLEAAGSRARQQAAAYLARQGAPTGRTAATQAQISNSLAQSMAAMQASAMAQGLRQHEDYRQAENARRDAAVAQVAGMRGEAGLLPAAASYAAGRGIDAGMFALTGNPFGGGGDIYGGRSPYGSTSYPGQGLGFRTPEDYDEYSKYW